MFELHVKQHPLCSAMDRMKQRTVCQLRARSTEESKSISEGKFEEKLQGEMATGSLFYHLSSCSVTPSNASF